MEHQYSAPAIARPPNALLQNILWVLTAVWCWQVNYRESISRPVDLNYTHKKQSGGSGQFAQVPLLNLTRSCLLCSHLKMDPLSCPQTKSFPALLRVALCFYTLGRS